MNMYKHISLVLIMLLLLIVVMPGYAASVHKWVDAQGVTHYSDQLPENYLSTEVNVTHIDISAVHRDQNEQDDYYSVSNQWARMKEERTARKQLQLEKAKLKASQRADVPQVVYVNQAEEPRASNFYYPINRTFIGHRGYGHRYNAGKKHIRSYNEASCKLPRRGFLRSPGSGLTLTFR